MSLCSALLAQVERAKALKPTWRERYFIYSADMQQKSLSQNEHSDESSTLDLQAYLELQNTLQGVSKAHRVALIVNRRFWRLMVHDKVSFRTLERCFMDMDLVEKAAERAYKAAIEKHPKNVKLLRGYAHFAENVLKEPARAQRLRGEAEKRERAAEAKAKSYSVNGGLNEKSDAIIVASSTGVRACVRADCAGEASMWSLAVCLLVEPARASACCSC